VSASIIIRNLDERDNEMLHLLRERFFKKTNSKALMSCGHEFLRMEQEIERLSEISRSYYKLKVDCSDLVFALDNIREKVTE
jgi:hypothetical protein